MDTYLKHTLECALTNVSVRLLILEESFFACSLPDAKQRCHILMTLLGDSVVHFSSLHLLKPPLCLALKIVPS